MQLIFRLSGFMNERERIKPSAEVFSRVFCLHTCTLASLLVVQALNATPLSLLAPRSSTRVVHTALTRKVSRSHGRTRAGNGDWLHSPLSRPAALHKCLSAPKKYCLFFFFFVLVFKRHVVDSMYIDLFSRCCLSAGVRLSTGRRGRQRLSCSVSLRRQGQLRAIRDVRERETR